MTDKANLKASEYARILAAMTALADTLRKVNDLRDKYPNGVKDRLTPAQLRELSRAENLVNHEMERKAR